MFFGIYYTYPVCVYARGCVHKLHDISLRVKTFCLVKTCHNSLKASTWIKHVAYNFNEGIIQSVSLKDAYLMQFL